MEEPNLQSCGSDPNVLLLLIYTELLGTLKRQAKTSLPRLTKRC